MTTRDGTPVWFELTTADQDKAQSFYQKLAGWTVAPTPIPDSGGYLIAGPDADNGVAGLMTATEGMPTGWRIYFAAADVDALARRVAALGGQVHVGPMDIPGVGRFAAVTDPQGVMFNIIAGHGDNLSTAYKPGDSGNFGHGVWIELATPDPDAAFAFYGELFGWTKAGAMPMGEMGEYAFIGAPGGGESCPEGEPTGPGAVMSSAKTGAPARWNWYVHVPDIDAAIATATAGGGTLIQGPDQIPGGDYSANVADDGGNQIGLVGPRRQ